MTRPEALDRSRLQLRVLLPTEVLVDTTVVQINALGEQGEFCLLPRHVDCVVSLSAGVLSFRRPDGALRYLGLDNGVLVKCGQTVSVSAYNGVLGDDLEALEALVESRYRALDEAERKARTALARLEAGALRGFQHWREDSYER